MPALLATLAIEGPAEGGHVRTEVFSWHTSHGTVTVMGGSGVQVTGPDGFWLTDLQVRQMGLPYSQLPASAADDEPISGVVLDMAPFLTLGIA